MKIKLIIFTVALFICAGANAQEIGRFKVSASDSKTVMIDTKTGQSWILLPSKYQQRSATDQQYEWNKIGFAKGSHPRKKK